MASHFDAWGRQDYANVYSDDGSRDQHDYDQDGSQGWSAVVSHFDTWGREAHADMYRDDGGRDWHDYDENGSQSWNVLVSHFDASGREAHTNLYMDDGSRTLVDYSVAPGYRMVSRYNAQGYLILKEEATAWLPGGPLPAPLPSFGGPLPAMPFYAPPAAAPLNPFISPAFPFHSQPSWSLPVDDDPYPDAYVEVGPLTPSEPW